MGLFTNFGYWVQHLFTQSAFEYGYCIPGTGDRETLRKSVTHSNGVYRYEEQLLVPETSFQVVAPCVGKVIRVHSLPITSRIKRVVTIVRIQTNWKQEFYEIRYLSAGPADIGVREGDTVALGQVLFTMPEPADRVLYFMVAGWCPKTALHPEGFASVQTRHLQKDKAR